MFQNIKKLCISIHDLTMMLKFRKDSLVYKLFGLQINSLGSIILKSPDSEGNRFKKKESYYCNYQKDDCYF